MSERRQPAGESPTSDLLYPFYLDSDMSMAFAAALAGGVALEAEQVARVEEASKAVRNLRGSLRAFGVGAGEAGREQTGSTGRTDESTLVRRHTAHSIFINLYDELRSTGRLIDEPDLSDVAVGDLVSMRLTPAIAPLRRVIDQVLRLLDLMAPVLGIDPEPPPSSRQERRQRARDAAKANAQSDDEGIDSLRGLHRLFTALRDDLEHSGMIDVVVTREDAPGVLLTLDKRFATQTGLELLHTSSFRVAGKVTGVWPTEDDVVLLYRRSVLALVPALAQQVSVGVFAFLIGVAKSVGTVDLERDVRAALGETEAAPDQPEGQSTGQLSIEPSEMPATSEEEDDDVLIGNDIVALHPAMSGPAIQILPLALCV